MIARRPSVPRPSASADARGATASRPDDAYRALFVHDAETGAILDANTRRVREHGRRANAVVEGMMEHARPTSGEPARRQAVDVNALVAGQVAVAVGGHRDRDPAEACEVVADYGADVGTVGAAPPELARVVQALLANALDAVEARAGAEPEFVPQLRVRTRHQPDAVVIEVASAPGEGATFTVTLPTA